jgi:hypothetical protein
LLDEDVVDEDVVDENVFERAIRPTLKNGIDKP